MRIRRVINKIKKEKETKPDLFSNKDIDLGFKVFKLKPSNFKIWRRDTVKTTDDLEKQLDVFIDPVKKDAREENILSELLLKSGYDLNSKIEKKTCNSVDYYSIEDGEMVVVLSSINEELTKEIIKQKPDKVICLDRLFSDNDQLKTNTVLQMKDAGIEFKTV